MWIGVQVVEIGVRKRRINAKMNVASSNDEACDEASLRGPTDLAGQCFGECLNCKLFQLTFFSTVTSTTYYGTKAWGSLPFMLL